MVYLLSKTRIVKQTISEIDKIVNEDVDNKYIGKFRILLETNLQNYVILIKMDRYRKETGDETENTFGRGLYDYNPGV